VSYGEKEKEGRVPIMPAKSKAQARFMRGVASGDIKAKGLSKKEAKEFVEGHSTKGLPEKVKKKSHSSGKAPTTKYASRRK